MAEHMSAGDDHLRLVRSVVASQFPNFGTAGGTGRLLREFHPVVRLRVAYGNARLVRSARTSRTLRSVAAGSGVFARLRTAELAKRQSRLSSRRA